MPLGHLRSTLGKLNNLQFEHTLRVAKLIAYAYLELGVALSCGDAYRDKRVFGAFGSAGLDGSYGKWSSLHKMRLANDFNLFKWDGEVPPTLDVDLGKFDYAEAEGEWEYCADNESHRELAEYWRSIGGTPGIDFNDGNHYSTQWKQFK